jgi:hypothetical protein
MKRSDRTSITLIALRLAGDTDRQAFMGELVEHVEHPILASIVGAILDEVIGRGFSFSSNVEKKAPGRPRLSRWPMSRSRNGRCLDASEAILQCKSRKLLAGRHKSVSTVDF